MAPCARSGQTKPHRRSIGGIDESKLATTERVMAKAEPHTRLVIESGSFDVGDGSRRVSILDLALTTQMMIPSGRKPR